MRTGGTYRRNANVPDLIDKAMERVDAWSTTRHRNVQEILVGLKEAALGVNRLRNSAGDGHGDITAATGVDDRDGRLAP